MANPLTLDFWRDLLGPRRAPAALPGPDAIDRAVAADEATFLARQREAQIEAALGPAPAPPVIREVERVVVRFDSLSNSLSGMGLSGDSGAAARPNLEILPLDWDELEHQYEHSGLCARVVNKVADDGTKKGWGVIDKTASAKPMEAEDARLDFRARVGSAWTWARLYGAGYLLYICEEAPDPNAPPGARANYATPLDPARLLAVLNLIVLTPRECSAMSYEDNPASHDFGEPRTYMVSPQNPGSGILAGGVEVHRSRLLHFRGHEIPVNRRRRNYGIDASVLQLAWDSLRNRITLGQTAATIGQKLCIDAMTIGGMDGYTTGDQSATFGLRQRVNAKTLSATGMLLLPAGDTVQRLGAPIAGFDTLIDAADESCSADTGLPRVQLFGETPGGLNADGESSRDGWAMVVASEQNRKLRRALMTHYRLLYSARRGPTGGVVPEGWTLEFNPIDELTDAGRAALRKTTAETDQLYIDAGVLPPEHIARSRFGPDGWSAEILPYDAAETEPDEAALAASEAALGPALVEDDGDDEPLTAAAAARLAVSMTTHQMTHCEHGRNNRCDLCGVIKDRDVAPGADGKPGYTFEWRPIRAVAANVA